MYREELDLEEMEELLILEDILSNMLKGIRSSVNYIFVLMERELLENKLSNHKRLLEIQKQKKN